MAAFPPFGQAWLAFLALVPLFVAVRGRGPWTAGLLGYLFGAVFAMGVGHWVTSIDGFRWYHFLVLGGYLGAFFAPFGVLLGTAARVGIPFVFAAPVLWVGAEYLRANAGPLAHPWALLAHTQSGNLPLIQVATVGGAYAVSFLVVMVNAALAQALIGRRRRWPLGAALAVLLAAVAFGWTELRRAMPPRSVPVTAIQPNIAQVVKWDPDRVKEHLAEEVALTRRAAAAAPSALVVWPENSVEAYVEQAPDIAEPVVALSGEIERPILIGSDRRPAGGLAPVYRTDPSGVTQRLFRPVFGAVRNSAYLVRPDGLGNTVYDKRRLVPFTEFQPWPRLPWPEDFRRTTPDYVAGEREVLFDAAGDAGPARFGVLICWESMFPDRARSEVLAGADFLVSITNDSWAATAAARQFLAASVFRAVENRTALVRVVNTGVSAFVGPYGRVLGRVTEGDRDTFVAGYLTRRVPLRQGRTLYTRFGDVFAFACLTLSAAAVAFAAARGIPAWRKRRSA